ncbi:MAG: amidoligase family protein [Bdellovibrionales bacterium]|nr:amidoligase family protein [Bdellovibrionales bacterium]
MAFLLPPRQLSYTDAERSIGFELEYASVDIPTVARIVQRVFGGEIIEESSFSWKVEHPRLGHFSIEIDTSILKEKQYIKPLRALGLELSELESPVVEHSLLSVFSLLAPFAFTTPPLPLREAARVEELRAQLRSAGAAGTGASLCYAFGLHLNVEVASFDVKYLLNILRAFIILYPELMERERIDSTRKITHYINPFSRGFVRLIINPQYRPTMASFVRDYLRWNPSRNRPLDMLPIFALHHGEQIRSDGQDARLIKARPAFHYRLPNCSVDAPEWRIAHAWNNWVLIERLAERQEDLDDLGERYLAAMEDERLEHLWEQHLSDNVGRRLSP